MKFKINLQHIEILKSSVMESLEKLNDTVDNMKELADDLRPDSVIMYRLTEDVISKFFKVIRRLGTFFHHVCEINSVEGLMKKYFPGEKYVNKLTSDTLENFFTIVEYSPQACEFDGEILNRIAFHVILNIYITIKVDDIVDSVHDYVRKTAERFSNVIVNVIMTNTD